MVDAKVCNAATSTSSTMRCYICGEISKNFNNLNCKKKVNNDALKFGLSILHTRIRFFEHLLHLTYKFLIQKWHDRKNKDKIAIRETKQITQNYFKE